MTHEHEHHHHECEDPHCSCHNHNHEHEHHHHHERECDDPHCSCHDHSHRHSPAEELIENAMTIGQQRHFTCAEPVSRKELEERLKALLLQLGDVLAVEGCILGHLKGVISASDGSFFAVSVTRRGAADCTPSAHWTEGEALQDYDATLNLHSLVPKELDMDAAFSTLG